MSISLRIKELRESLNITSKDFALSLKVDNSQYSKIERGILMPTVNQLVEISSIYKVSLDWLINGEIIKEENQPIAEKKEANEIETRPRIPYDAAAGALSVALDGVTINHCEQLPVIKAFAKYDFTIIAKGDTMLPEYHSGDELACLYVKNSKFIQWGCVHVLDTSQGVVVKRIFKGDDCIICRSDNPNYPEFNIDGSELYNVALVIGMIRRY